MNSFRNFLNNHKAEKGGEYTHTSMGLPFKGRFYIPQADMAQFFRLYKKTIEDGHILSMTEKHKEVSPVVIDLDFRFPVRDGTERKYNLEHIRKIVSYYQSELDRAFIGDSIAYVYEKGTSGRVSGTKVKDGLHIMFPKMVTPPQAQLILRKKVVKRVIDDHVLDDIGFDNSPWEVFDSAVIDKNPWTMYGSGKAGEEVVWQITHVFDSDMVERSIPGERELVEILSLRTKNSEDRVEWRDGEVKEEYEKLFNESYKSKTKAVSFGTPGLDPAELEKIKQLVNMLDPKRANEYSEWVELGWCLHNIDPGLLPVWEEFSKKSDKYEDGKCAEVWSKAKDGGLNIGTLYYWARHDSPDEYKKFKSNRVYDEIIRSLNQGTDYSIAKVLHMMFGHKYVLASLKDKMWYEFVGHHWRPCEQGIFLRMRISNDLYEAYRDAEKRWSQWYDGLDEIKKEEMRGTHEERHGQFTTIYHKLNTTKFKNDIMKSAEELFYYDDRHDKKFLEKLDSNRDLIGFENGVYDLAAPRVDEHGNELRDDMGNPICGVFREGKPSDYVSLSTNINYIPFDPSAEEVFRCKKFMDDMFPDDEMRNYVLTLLSYCLSGHISEEKLWMLIGKASNGKSALLELFKHSFGQYFETVSPKILTTKRGSPEGASPELAKLKGIRFVAISEPEKDDMIQGGFTKLLSGGDDISCRKLYKDPISYKPQFTLAMLSNYFLDINTTDDGIFRRIRAVECKVKFCDNPEEGNPYEKKVDRTIKNNFPDWAEAFMSILIEYYTSVYTRDGLIEPEEVKAYTKKYQQDVDIFLEYTNENITKVEGEMLSITNVYTHFKNWFKEQTDARKAPSRKDLRAALEKKYGPAKKKKGLVGWSGLALADELEPEEGEVVNELD